MYFQYHHQYRYEDDKDIMIKKSSKFLYLVIIYYLNDQLSIAFLCNLFLHLISTSNVLDF